MPTITKETDIAAPPEKVYAYLADLTRHSEWAKHPIEIRKTSDGDVAVGATYESDSKMMGSHHAKIVVTELVPNQRIAFEADDDTGRFRHTIELSAAGSGTHVKRSVTRIGGSFINGVMATLMMPLLGSKIAAGDLERIKAKIEAMPAAA